MGRTLWIMLAALVSAPAAATPVTVQCKLGPSAPIYGRLTVLVDIEARFVAIEASKMPGVRWEYREG